MEEGMAGTIMLRKLKHIYPGKNSRMIAAVNYLNTKEGSAGKSSSSGFRPASEFGIRYHGIPDGEDASFFLCRELIPGYLKGITGVYAPPSGYLVDPKEVEKFDRLFPPKEKKKLPGQLFE